MTSPPAAGLSVIATPVHAPNEVERRAFPLGETATLSTEDGRYVTGGMLELKLNGAGWTATLRDLDRPGVVASMYFCEGIRNVTVRLADGRRANARIARTSFVASRRVCELIGAGDLG